jgi:hypothetical protein
LTELCGKVVEMQSIVQQCANSMHSQMHEINSQTQDIVRLSKSLQEAEGRFAVNVNNGYHRGNTVNMVNVEPDDVVNPQPTFVL